MQAVVRHALGGRAIRVAIGIVQVGADQRLHARIPTRRVELHQAEQVGVIRERHRRHPQFCHPLRQIPHLGQPVAQRILAVDGQVDEHGPALDRLGAFRHLVASLVRNRRRSLDILDFDDFAHGGGTVAVGRPVYRTGGSARPEFGRPPPGRFTPF